MSSTWIATYKDGTQVRDSDYDAWSAVPNKINIIRMVLYWNGVERVRLDNKTFSAPTTRAVMGLGRGSPQVVSKAIGHYDGRYVLMYRINSITGKLTLEKLDNNILVETKEL